MSLEFIGLGVKQVMKVVCHGKKRRTDRSLVLSSIILLRGPCEQPGMIDDHQSSIEKFVSGKKKPLRVYNQ